MRWNRLGGFVPALALWLACASGAWGQTTFGSITGSVLDSSGAAIPQAQVTLTNLGTKEKRTQPTGNDGLYQFVDLIPGQYSLEVDKQGFQHFKREPVVVEVQKTVRIDVSMQLGAVTQTVEVTAQTPLLQSSTSDLGQVITGRQVNELPLNGRNPMNLVALAPSVVPQGQSQGNPVGKNPFDYSNYQIGGAITNQGAEYLDGVPLNNSYINELSLLPIQDALQEFKVQTNNLSAEWGRFAGGVVNFTTKSGTNSLHGTAYEYLRNTSLNARDFFIPNRGPFHQNQYGFNVGGPVYLGHLYDGRAKTFFFVAWEGFRQRIGQTFVENVPTLAERQGDFTDYRDKKGNLIPIYDPTTTRPNPNFDPTQKASASNMPFLRDQFKGCNGNTPNVICPSIIAGNPAVQFMLKQFPNPTSSGDSFTHFNNYVASSSGGGNNDGLSVRVDRNVSDKQHISGRWARWTNLNFPIDPFKTGVCQDRCTEKYLTHNFVVDDVYNFSPTSILDMRVSYGRLAYDRIPAAVGIDLSQVGPNWAPLNNQVVLRDLPIPCIDGGFDGPALRNVFCTQGAGSVIIARDDTPRIAGSLTTIKGRHTLQYGGEYRIDHHNYLQTNTPVGMFNFSSSFTQVNPTIFTLSDGTPTGAAFASFLLGYGTGVNQGFVSPVASQQIYPALYAQDQFKATSKLTLNLGVRWEQNGPYSERFNRISVLEPNAPTNLPQPPCSILPAATATAFGASKICLPALKGELGIVASSERPQRYSQDKPWHQFSPHLGFAYQWNPKTVIRGGYGLFWISNAVEFDEAPNTDGVNSIGTPWITTADGGNSPCVNPAPCNVNGVVGPTFNLSNPFPNGIDQPPGRNIALYQSLRYGQGPFALAPSNPYAYYQQWNLDVQRELPDGTLIDLAYAGTKGTHLPDFSQQINPLPDKYLSLGDHLRDLVPNPFQRLLGQSNKTNLNKDANIQLQQLLLPFPQYTGYAIGAAGWGKSIYHSFQAKAEKRMKGGGALLVAYTISKMITTGDVDSLTGWLEAGGQGGITDWNNRKNERSLSSFDVPQRLVVSYVLDLPVGHGKRFLSNASGVGGKLVSGWGLEGTTLYQRGFPLNFGTTGLTQGQNIGGIRPNKSGTGALSGRPESRLGGNNAPKTWFDKSVFSLPGNFTFGNESRVDPILRADGIKNWDFSIFKDTRFGPENRLGMQFRTEVFNLFNRPQFGPPNRTVGSGNLGIVNSTVNNPRLIQFALRFTF